MKFSLVAALSLAAPAFTQLVQIIEPMASDNVTRGQPFLVSVWQPEYIQSFTDVGIAITVAECGTLPCGDKSSSLGDVLYAGAFDPVTPLPRGGFYQNFTVVAPSNIDAGPAAISVVHSALIGTGPEPFTEVVNVTVFLQ